MRPRKLTREKAKLESTNIFMRSGSLWPLAAVPVLESSRAAPSRYGRIRALFFVLAAQSGTVMWRILLCPPFPYGPATGSLKHPTHPAILPGLPNGAPDIAKRADTPFWFIGFFV